MAALLPGLRVGPTGAEAQPFLMRRTSFTSGGSGLLSVCLLVCMCKWAAEVFVGRDSDGKHNVPEAASHFPESKE